MQKNNYDFRLSVFILNIFCFVHQLQHQATVKDTCDPDEKSAEVEFYHHTLFCLN